MSVSRGFTLLELLIGMALLGFLLALLFGGFRLASTSWNAIEDRAEKTQDDDAGISAIRRLVAAAQPMHLKEQANQPLAFSGNRQELRLMAPLTMQFGLRTVEVSIDPDDQAANAGGVRLVLRHGAVRFTGEQFAEDLRGNRDQVLVGRLSNANFAYFGPEKRGTEPQWWDDWPNPDQFPTLVRLHLVPRAGAAYDLDMTPMINGDRIASIRVTAGPR